MAHIVFVESNLAGLSALVAAKALGHEVTFLYSPNNTHLYGDDLAHPSLRAVDRLVPLASTTCAKTLEIALRELLKGGPIDAIITVLEYCVLPVAEAAATLGIRGTNPAAIRSVRNKHVLRATLADLGIEDVASQLLQPDAPATWDRYPAIVKPAAGVASYFAQVVRSPEDLATAVKTYADGLSNLSSTIANVIAQGGLLVEEYFHGPMLSVEVLVAGGIGHLLTVGLRKRSVDNEVLELGTQMPAALPQDAVEHGTAHVMRAISALGFDRGILHVECILSSNGPRIIEINPRLMGGTLPHLYSRVHDTCVYDLLLDCHLDEPIKLPLPSPRRCGVSRVFGAIEAGKICGNIDLSWKDSFASFLLDLSLLAVPNQAVPQLRSNHDYLGSFTLLADSAEEADKAADNVIDLLEKSLGVSLAK